MRTGPIRSTMHDGEICEVREERARVASASCACCVDMCTMCQHVCSHLSAYMPSNRVERFLST